MASKIILPLDQTKQLKNFLSEIEETLRIWADLSQPCFQLAFTECYIIQIRLPNSPANTSVESILTIQPHSPCRA